MVGGAEVSVKALSRDQLVLQRRTAQAEHRSFVTCARVALAAPEPFAHDRRPAYRLSVTLCDLPACIGT